jgi:hypothetical protein
MSFNHFARKVLNPTLPMGVRCSALHSCILQLVWKTGEPFSQARDRLYAEFGFRRNDPTEYQLLSTLAAIQRERNLILEQLRAYERRRIREKMLGRRCVSKEEQDALRKLYGMELGAVSKPPDSGNATPRLSKWLAKWVGEGKRLGSIEPENESTTPPLTRWLSEWAGKRKRLGSTRRRSRKKPSS